MLDYPNKATNRNNPSYLNYRIPSNAGFVKRAALSGDSRTVNARDVSGGGVAVMSTYGYEGAPLGKYKVIVTKNIQEDLVYAESSTGTKDVVDWTPYSTVKPIYFDAKTTPHEIEITGKGKKIGQTFDVGKAIKMKI